MTMRMLIDARHREETRVAVVKGNRVEEFDFESAEHKQLKGNIYLAKVTRVEPSLQAAFVDYGGNRHGFLAFSEIHPDYYQIPKEDREALLREEAEHAAEEERLRAEEERRAEARANSEEDADTILIGDEEGDDEAAPPRPETASGTDEITADELRNRRQALRRRYKIQDVIRRRQVLLVQVVKEERGNKGAALTTYLSLAGRYCVLMPNTSHGGGISRKISNGADRKRLKGILSELNLPPTMGCIVRTAGLQRTKTEIKRDFDYLARLWDEIREKTLKSAAPALIYEDSDLIKRAIRDIYNRDIDEVIVEGEEGFRAARAFMKLLMPSHVRRVKAYSEAVPLFQRHGVEDQLAAMYQPIVQLKSGGYLVINPTEALVSIDINSGRSTREHNIEQTAYQTNIEAAHEIARQLRLRDMAGLVVIDFIDMESNGHIRKVEKAMKEALKNDRARIQVGRISSFGLMEMSRQRLRTGVLEASTRICPHCDGTGLVRTAASAGLSALRMIEDEAARGRGSRIILHAGHEAAIYLLNRKRREIAEVEHRYGVEVDVVIENELEGARMSVEALGPPPSARMRIIPSEPAVEEEEDLLIEAETEEEAEEKEVEEVQSRGRERDRGEEGEGRGRRRRRRRGRRGGRRRGGEGHEGEGEEQLIVEAEAAAEPAEMAEQFVEQVSPAAEEEKKPKARRRPRARRKIEAEVPVEVQAAATPAEPLELQPMTTDDAAAEAPPQRPKRGRRKKADTKIEAVSDQPVAEEAPFLAAETAEPPAKPKRPSRARKKPAAPFEEAEPAVPQSAPAAEPISIRAAPAAGELVDAGTGPQDRESEKEEAPPRRGWWQRTFGN